jgi:glutathione S-transferase
MAEFVDLKQAVGMPGLRLVLISTTPSPWGEAVKGFFHVKKIPYVPVRHPMGQDQSLLRQLTAQESAPVAFYNDERPRSTWPEQLYLAERLNPDPPLIPDNLQDRARMFGWCNELAGETGLGWARREIIFARTLAAAPADDQRFAPMRAMARKYNYSAESAQAASQRIVEILRGLSEVFEEQKRRGRNFLIGERLSALDIMWAAFAALIKPLPEELCPMPRGIRAGFNNEDPAIEAALSPQLMAHRDFIYREYLELPLILERG